MTRRRPRPRLLILSFFDISVDPRVMKQVRLFARDYDVTTCSPGPLPHPDVAHIPLDESWVPDRGRIGNLVDDVAREREWFRWSYRQTPIVKQARRKLRGRRFDVAIANDADAVGVASGIVGASRVHADLHEFFPGLPQPEGLLGDRQRRYWTWLVRRHCAAAASATTVGAEIARRYAEYGVTPGVVTNATHRHDLPVRATGTPLRLVHSGNPFRDRGLGEIMRAVAASTSEVTLDLYLMTHNQVELAAVVELADALGDRIRVLEPVGQDELVETLNRYDVGIHVLPPTSENNSLALPNKFFDFVQARLAIIVGPSLEMARIVREHGLGIVTDDFSEESIRRSLDALTPDAVDAAKRAADAAAHTLSAESQVDVWSDAVAAIVSRRGVRS
ncbi:glycosyltransferase family 1 protein [Microbacterium sp. 179-I 3D2 NHS]|uniref:glycosyltransferase family 1 protein n=1 Tax=Microbacterium sp. 179-I 3D2 NHS TaxID=3235178 RepID=UPI0039A0535D